MPLAAYGGRTEIMSVVAPDGAVYQAGTLSGNPVATAAGLKTLELLDAAAYERLESLGARLEQGFERALSDKNLTACVQRVGSMITLHWADSRLEIHRVIVGPYANNVFVLRCRETGDAVAFG